MSEFKSDTAKKTVSQKMISWLFREDDLSLGFSEWMNILSATLIIRNRQFSRDFFDALASKIASSYIDPDLSDLKKDFILYNALSYIPFADPQDGQILTIKGIDYAIEKIALTSGWLSSTYYAYGLKAIIDKQAQSLILFQGTTSPADHGFLAGIMADTRPVGSIGSQLYARGQEKLQLWICGEYQRTQKRVLCTGQSLGGAMSLHAHIHQPNAVDYFAVNPPTLTHREQRIYKKTNPGHLVDENTRVLTVISHINDPVFSLGSHYLPKSTKIYRHGKKDENMIMTHAKAPDCGKDAPELHWEEHDNSKQIKSYFWKIIKPFLFVAILILHAIALPVRIAIEIARVLILSLSRNKKPPTPDTPQNSCDFDEKGVHGDLAKFRLDTRPENSAPLHFFEAVQLPTIQPDSDVLHDSVQLENISCTFK